MTSKTLQYPATHHLLRFSPLNPEPVLRHFDFHHIIRYDRANLSLGMYSEQCKEHQCPTNKRDDYNLNIPRYVDTFEEEAPTDLAQVAEEIKKIDSEMVDIDKKIASYCKELDISSPFGGKNDR